MKAATAKIKGKRKRAIHAATRAASSEIRILFSIIVIIKMSSMWGSFYVDDSP
jgi:hypothetical protein